MSKPRQSILFILLALSTLYFFSLFIKTDLSPCEAHHHFLDFETEGKVVRKYIVTTHQSFKSYTSRRDTVIVLDNETTLSMEGQGFYKSIYVLADSNDHIIKRRGSDTIFLYRKEVLLSTFCPAYGCKDNQ